MDPVTIDDTYGDAVKVTTKRCMVRVLAKGDDGVTLRVFTPTQARALASALNAAADAVEGK